VIDGISTGCDDVLLGVIPNTPKPADLLKTRIRR
jgi:hypothetical protein